MDDCMSFPPTWQDFVAQYQFRDSEEVYTNGSKLVQVFRIEQMMEHYHKHIEEENERLKMQVEALKDYAHALELCRNKAYLCEYCAFNGIDFDHDDINCTIDFDGLQKRAGCRKKIKEIINNG